LPKVASDRALESVVGEPLNGVDLGARAEHRAKGNRVSRTSGYALA
jgi:hypothetical protein